MSAPDTIPTRWHETLRIAADHPALPGHFPGRPVVPGVVLLDRVIAAIESHAGRAVTGLPQVKFLRPLLPDEAAELVLVADGRTVRFTLTRTDAAIATGSGETAA